MAIDLAAVLSRVAAVLPAISGDAAPEASTLRHAADAWTLIGHAVLVHEGWSLVPSSDSGSRPGADSSAGAGRRADPATPTTSRLPSDWNAHAPSELTLHYHVPTTGSESSDDVGDGKDVVAVQSMRFGDRRTVFAHRAREPDRRVEATFDVERLFRSDRWPVRLPSRAPADSGAADAADADRVAAALRAIVPDASALQAAVDTLGAHIVRPLASRASPAPTSPHGDAAQRTAPTHPPRADPLRLGGGSGGHGGFGAGGRMPVPVGGWGRTDLDPLAAAPGIIGIGGSGGGSRMGGFTGGGMTVEPDHPMFGQIGGGHEPDHSGNGVGRLPPGAVPPGARFDPIRPDIPQFPGQFGGGLRGGPRGGPPGAMPFSGDPDNDEMMPPGSRDMFL